MSRLRRALATARSSLTPESWGGWAAVAAPYAWLLLFFAVPLLIVIKISLSPSLDSAPPYGPLFELLEDGALRVTLHLRAYGQILTDDVYVVAWANAARTAAIATFFCLLLGYPMAYAIAKAERGVRPALLMLVTLPFWTSFLIRIYAWMGLLSDSGPINEALAALGVIDEPIQMLNTPFAVILGVVYAYLPFMVLPLYNALERLDPSLLEAAADLGCRPWRAFWSITWPLTQPGVIAGSLLVFIPAMGEVVIPELLGGPDTLMIGNLLWTEFFQNRDWPLASALATTLLLALLGPILLFQRRQALAADRR